MHPRVTPRVIPVAPTGVTGLKHQCRPEGRHWASRPGGGSQHGLFWNQVAGTGSRFVNRSLCTREFSTRNAELPKKGQKVPVGADYWADGTEVVQQAGGTPGFPGRADLPPVQDGRRLNVPRSAGGIMAFSASSTCTASSCWRRQRVGQGEPLAHAQDVGVDRQAREAEGDAADHVARLAPDPWDGDQVLQRRRAPRRRSARPPRQPCRSGWSSWSGRTRSSGRAPPRLRGRPSPATRASG